MVKSVNESEKSVVTAALGSKPSLIIHSAVIARLYKASEEDSNQWVKEAMGVIAIITDKSVNTHYLKLVDLQSQTVCFEQELYQNFEYAKPRDFFHTFETENCMAGLSFADTNEANEFFNKVLECKNTPATRMSMSISPRASVDAHSSSSPAASSSSYPPAASSPSASSSSYSPPAAYSPPTPTSSTSPAPPQTQTTGPSFKKKFMSLFGRKDDDSDFLPISEPKNFRHLSSIGWNPNEGSFEIRNIPPEWRKLFQAAGIKKSELKNKDTAAFVMNVIEQQRPSGGAPPPPPPSNAPAPPPPPPPPSGGGGPAAPPPPPVSAPSSSRAGLLSQIQKGTQLKHVEDNNDDEESAPPPSAGLAETLARAMAERRAAIKEDYPDPEEDDGEWSD